jgi:hypothetical protein
MRHKVDRKASVSDGTGHNRGRVHIFSSRVKEINSRHLLPTHLLGNLNGEKKVLTSLSSFGMINDDEFVKLL